MSHACPGCSWRDVPEDRAAVHKREAVVRALARFSLAPEVTATLARAPRIGYRTRAKLMVGIDARGRPRLGLYRPGTHEVVDEPACPLLAPVVAEVARTVRALLDEAPEPALRAPEAGGALRAVDIREVVGDGTPRAMLTLVLAVLPDDASLRRAAALVRARAPAVASVAVNLRGPGPQVLGPLTRIVDGPEQMRDRIGVGAPYTWVVHGSFVQAHREVAAALHDEICRDIAATFGGRGARRVVELHAGSGALALRLAAQGAQVLAIESFAPALERARQAADEQGITGLRIEARDATEAMIELAARGERADVVVLDPPRRGASPELRAAVAAVASARVTYVSCDPETLARDLAHFARLGWRVQRVVPLDMMPGTPHVEALAILDRAPPPPPRVLFEDERLLALDKDPHEPTTPHPEHAGSLLERVRALPGAAGAVPVHRLDVGTSGVCLFARAPEHVAALAAALAAGRKRYLALVRGIARPKGVVRRVLREHGRAEPTTTRYRRRAIVAGHSLLSVAPEQGRLHQIRRSLVAIGHPVLGDARYGHAPSNRHLFERAALDRTFLHCERIVLALPEGEHVLEAPLPADLALVLERLQARACDDDGGAGGSGAWPDDGWAGGTPATGTGPRGIGSQRGARPHGAFGADPG